MADEDKDIKTLDEIKQEADPDIEIHALRRQVESLKAENRKMQADYGDLKGYFRDVTNAALGLKIPPQPIVYKPSSEKKKVSSPCVAVFHWTDWHYGAVQEPDEIEFMGSFSPEQLEARIGNACASFIDWVEVHRSSYRIDECVVVDTGDNISGDIHRDLSITNAFPTPVQSVKCGILKGRSLLTLAPHFKKIRMEFLTPDNHGRLTDKPQAKQAGLNTHNYVVGHFAKLVSSDQKNLEFNIHISHSKSVQVSTRYYLLSHGHDVRGWAGFPYYGIERKVSREALVRLWEPDYNKFHRCVIGHWHAPLSHPWYWIGGSGSGTDALDHQQGRRSKPIQCVWLVHPRWGEFDRTELLLRDS